MVWPDIGTEKPKLSSAAALEALSSACWLQVVPHRTKRRLRRRAFLAKMCSGQPSPRVALPSSSFAPTTTVSPHMATEMPKNASTAVSFEVSLLSSRSRLLRTKTYGRALDRGSRGHQDVLRPPLSLPLIATLNYQTHRSRPSLAVSFCCWFPDHA